MVHQIILAYDESYNTIVAMIDKKPETICVIDEISTPCADATDFYNQLMDIIAINITK